MSDDIEKSVPETSSSLTNKLSNQSALFPPEAESSSITNSMKTMFDYETFIHKIDEATMDTAQDFTPPLNKIIPDQKVLLNKYIKNKLKEDYPNAFGSPGEKTILKQINPHLDYICDKIEAKALNFLFQEDKGTQIDMYACFNLTDSITASELNGRLEKLVTMGFLSRKKISPQLPFTISAFFIQIPIEMSKKNRDNPLYEYKPLISRKNLITYLQAKLYILKEKLDNNTANRSQLKKEIKAIQESLMILTQG